ncbi:hypothetical protein ACFQU2_22465 [Siccirubricoccus deserti]|nr:hypothetical protein [Siccirubricoccus deserti]
MEIELNRQLHGTSVMKVDGVGLPLPGDPIRLLWDIEQAVPFLQ